MTTIERIEMLIGENLQLLADKLDLHIRQGDQEAMRGLRAINDAWKDICFLMCADRWSRMQGKDCNSVIDTLWADYAKAKVGK